MPASSVSRLPNTSWQQATQNIICGEPPDVLNRLHAAFEDAATAHDHELCAAISAHALAFMLVDWSRFAGWREWICRFEAAGDSVGLMPSSGSSLLMRAMGALACGLLRGDTNEALAPLGQRLESMLDMAEHPVLLALAAGTLLPWLQMSKNPAAAQATGQFLAELGLRLHVDRLIDRLVRHPPVWIVGMLPTEPGRDLLRRPRLSKQSADHRPQPRTQPSRALRRGWPS